MLTLRLPSAPEQLRSVGTAARPIRVDKVAGIIRGYALAKEGDFKSKDRGAFSRDGLRAIVRLTNAAQNGGLQSRFGHPDFPGDDLGKHLGRARNAWLDESGPVWIARADLHVARASRSSPFGDLGGYVLNLAAEDPDALSTSLVILPTITERQGLSPLWHPVALFASDVVSVGEAVDGILSWRPVQPSRPASPPTPRRGSPLPPAPKAGRSLALRGTVAVYRVSKGSLAILPPKHPKGSSVAGLPVLQPGCFVRSLQSRRPIPLYLDGYRGPVAHTGDHSLVVADGKVALELTTYIQAAGAQALIRGAGGGRLPYMGVIPDFDMSTASFCHVRDEFWIKDAELLSLTLTTRAGGSTGFVRIDR